MSESRLLTLNEAADQTGLTVDALRKRIKRGRLRAFRGNDGLIRVRLNDPEIEALRADSPSSRPAGQVADESPVVRVLEAHNATLREQLAKAEQRATKAEERAEKAEQRLIEELARLAGQNASAPASGLNGAEKKGLNAFSAARGLEPEGEGPPQPPGKPEGLAEGTVTGVEPRKAEAPCPAFRAGSEPVSATPATSPMPSLVSKLRRGWWSQLLPSWRRVT